jgi:hypothetical protein
MSASARMPRLSSNLTGALTYEVFINDPLAQDNGYPPNREPKLFSPQTSTLWISSTPRSRGTQTISAGPCFGLAQARSMAPANTPKRTSDNSPQRLALTQSAPSEPSKGSAPFADRRTTRRWPSRQPPQVGTCRQRSPRARRPGRPKFDRSAMSPTKESTMIRLTSTHPLPPGARPRVSTPTPVAFPPSQDRVNRCGRGDD